MTTIQILKKLISDNKLQGYTFHFVAHQATVNWRQNNPSFYDKIHDIADGIKFGQHILIPLRGSDVDESVIVASCTPEQPLLSVTSKVVSPDSTVFHLPMMNLHLDYPITLAELRKSISTVSGTDAYHLLSTDKFFHVYGQKMLTEQEWKIYNLKFLMADALVSPRYIGHSLERGFNTLRVNALDSVKKVCPYLIDEQNNAHLDAKTFAITMHGNQKRLSGEMYYHHLLEVYGLTLNIIQELELEIPAKARNDIQLAALLHDTIEDTHTDYEDIVDIANRDVADLVIALSNDKRLPSQNRYNEALQRIQSGGLYVHIIKLSDIYSNLKGLRGDEPQEWSDEFRENCHGFLQVLCSEVQRSIFYDECKKLLIEFNSKE